MELLVETARLWRGLGHHDGKGRFRIDGVTGPDEYSAIADNNVYTNLMAARNLRAAAEMVARHPDRAGQLSVNEEEAAGWRDAAAAMMVPFDSELGVHCQSEGFTSHQVWDFASTSPDQYPLLLHFPYFDLYRKQVVKQADLALAMQLCGEAFTAEEKLHNFDYYERLTVRDSSLSACSQAVMAAEVGHLDLAYDYLGEAALMDLDDLEHNTRDGVHIASLAGSVIATLMGFGGVRINNGELLFAPRLPGPMTRLKFHIVYCLRTLRVEVTQKHSVYTLEEGDPLHITHHGRRLTLSTDKPRTESIPRMLLIDPPTQPPGRAPARRRPQR
jgi:alpha,alpha-trehalose phosphorylase